MVFFRFAASQTAGLSRLLLGHFLGVGVDGVPALTNIHECVLELGLL